MPRLPVNVYSVAAIREIERQVIEDDGVPGYELMCRAGAAVVQASREQFPVATQWQVLAGGGNNGGDGYAVARLAAREGIAVTVLALVDPDRLRGDAAAAYADFAADDGTVLPWEGVIDKNADMLIDAILGSGLHRDVEGSFADAVAAINEHAARVHALDIPTGIQGDTGALLGAAVTADLTTTFVGLKAGLFLGVGGDYCGRLKFADLGIDTTESSAAGVVCHRVHDDLLHRSLPPRACTGHKGDYGHVLVVGGGVGMPGAAQLCGMAALRAGAGRVSIATHPSHAATVAAMQPELMAHGTADAEDLAPLLASADVVAFGPGLGRSQWADRMFSALQADTRPAVWDADALNILAGQPDVAANRVITPHPGEAARLLASDTAEIQRDRLAALGKLVSTYGGTTVLKGAGSLISTVSGTPRLCTSGNPGMAAPGMGDALTGVIAALLAQGLSRETAAAVGVEVHARAGDLAAEGGERGLIARDVIDQLRSVVNP